jgi:arylsulfatase A-like enzyme
MTGCLTEDKNGCKSCALVDIPSYASGDVASTQRTPILDRTWPWVVATTVVLLTGLAWVFLPAIEIRGGDPRGLGSAAELEALSERSDLNVLFILIDTLGADHLGSYGYERDTSPNMDLLASRGVRFDRNLAQSSWTKSSMASLWTGLYPHRTGVTRFQHGMSEDAQMPAETLRDAGYRTVGLWRNGWIDPTFGFGQGFDVYHRPVTAGAPEDVRRENPSMKGGLTDTSAILAAEEFLRIYGDEPWFLYMHLMDVHEYTYDPESALFGNDYEAVYDNSIRRVDHLVGQFLVHLAEEGYLENTVIVIGSDHGEAFRERGFEGHARHVYRESTEVPLILSFPFLLEPGVVISSRTRNLDIWPTVLDLLGLPVPENIDGESLVPEILAALRGELAPASDREAISYVDGTWGQREAKPLDVVAVVDGPFRMIREATLGGELVEQLFDSREGDGFERENVIEENEEVAARLRDRAIDYLENSTPPWNDETPEVELDEMRLNLLRALGYKID